MQVPEHTVHHSLLRGKLTTDTVASITESAYSGHTSLRTGQWSNRRRERRSEAMFFWGTSFLNFCWWYFVSKVNYSSLSLSLRLLSVCAKEEKKRWHESAHYPVYCRGTFCNFTRFTSLHYPHSNIRCLSGLRADVWQAVSSSCFVISLLNVG